MSDRAVRVLTAAEEWLAHLEECPTCKPHGVSCHEGTRLLLRASELTTVRMTGLLIDISDPDGAA